MPSPSGALPQSVADAFHALCVGRNPEDNYRTVFHHYYPQVFRFFLRKGIPEEDCRDLTQEVFFSVYRNLKDLKQESQFQAWLFTIARNAFTSELSRKYARKRDAPVEARDSADLDAEPGREAGQLDRMLDEEKVAKLHAALEELPDQMRRCVRFRVRDDCSYEEIATSMGLSVNTVKAHLFKARKVLSERLRPHFGEWGL